MANMKFKDLKNNELQNKCRTIADLVNYIGLEAPSHPNYSIFLGAGASVTSGIKSGGHLVNSWRKEIYEQLSKSLYVDDSIKDPDERTTQDNARRRAVEFLIKDHGAWYNPQNEYSSLFERKFDLPSQRRRFVENIVDGKLPSIGYLYLISLVNKGFFNTIFTTNFDDLVNEAFYQFSATRPLICAHDSAINSISVVSKRPKIIKLHGDYLFDDIKNTLRETESLEQNTKEKFIEFSKDNGIIIVGYSGQDRSIIDVLNYLLQQEEYLKNGLYWCFRPDDEISHEVRKILWKDKVYCVEINGFDELFTQISHINNCKPNLIENPRDSKRDQCINKFIDDYQKNPSKDPIIKEFIEEISARKDNQDITELLAQLHESKTNNISNEDLKKLLEIENLIRRKKFSVADLKINEGLSKAHDKDIKNNYNILKIKLFKASKDNKRAIEILDELIIEDQFDSKYYFWKLDFLKNHFEKIEFLKKCNINFHYNFMIKNKLISSFIDYYDSYDEEPSNLSTNDCERLIQESFNLDSSLDNEVYNLRFNFIKKVLLRKNADRITKTLHDKYNQEIVELINTTQRMNKYHIRSIKLRKSYVIFKNDAKLIFDFTQSLELMTREVNYDRKQEIISIISDLYQSFNEEEYNNIEENHYKVIEEFFNDSSYFSEKSKNIDFLVNKSQYYLAKNKDGSTSYDILRQTLLLPNFPQKIDDITYLICSRKDSNQSEFIKNFLNENKNKINIEFYNSCMAKVENSNGNHEATLFYLREYFNSFPDDKRYYTQIAYAMLLSKNYDGVLSFINENMKNILDLSSEDKSILEINRITAIKLSGKVLDKNECTKLDNLISKSSLITSKNDHKQNILVCCKSLLGNNDGQALHHMKHLVDKNYQNFYSLCEWPAISVNLKEQITKYFNDKVVVK